MTRRSSSGETITGRSAFSTSVGSVKASRSRISSVIYVSSTLTSPMALTALPACIANAASSDSSAPPFLVRSKRRTVVLLASYYKCRALPEPQYMSVLRSPSESRTLLLIPFYAVSCREFLFSCCSCCCASTLLSTSKLFFSCPFSSVFYVLSLTLLLTSSRRNFHCGHFSAESRSGSASRNTCLTLPRPHATGSHAIQPHATRPHVTRYHATSCLASHHPPLRHPVVRHLVVFHEALVNADLATPSSASTRNAAPGPPRV